MTQNGGARLAPGLRSRLRDNTKFFREAMTKDNLVTAPVGTSLPDRIEASRWTIRIALAGWTGSGANCSATRAV